jgi:hypothetical protein
VLAPDGHPQAARGAGAARDEPQPPEPKASRHSYVSNLRWLVAGAGLNPKAVLASAVLDDLREFDFTKPFTTALVEDKLVAHTVRAEAEIACNRGHAVIGELEALIGEHPYRSRCGPS